MLLRDASRSCILAIKTIRKQGLKHRIVEPSKLMTNINKLCMKMANTRRNHGGKKARKAILRELAVRIIAKHAQNYRDLLAKEWQQTNWTLKQAQQVIARIDAILAQLPKAIKQAHEGIIGARMIAAPDKILSLDDRDAAVIMRGKAGNEVEFGHKLLSSEQ